MIEEEKKKKDKIKQQAREQVKQLFDKVNNQPGLKEIQDKGDSSKNNQSSDDEEGEEKAKKPKKKKP